jgi:hypothetical protein
MALARRTAFKRGDLKAATQRESLRTPELLETRTWDELLLRSLYLGPRWPLRIRGARVARNRPSPIDLRLYRFFCAFGAAGGVDDEDRQLFEEVVLHLVSALTGQLGLRIGHPASTGMSASFRERVVAYCSLSGIVDWEVKDAPLPTDNDLGLDVVSWIRFADGRGGDLHFVVQCATGSDWREKLADIDIAVWSDHVHWGVPPVRVFATPLVISLPEARWIRVVRRGGLLLDRPRLCELAQNAELPASLVARVGQRSRALLVT